MQDAYAHCERLVREADKDRYLAALFVPEPARRHVWALYAFSAEIAAVRERAVEPMSGEVRLQWWRDALADGAAGNPVAAALNDTIERFGLSRDLLLALIEARSFDLYDEAMPSRETFDSYLRATASSLFELAASALGNEREKVARAAKPSGIAYGITGLLRAFPLHASRGQIFLPLDLLEEFSARPEDILAGRSTPALLAALSLLRSHARAALTDAREQIASLPPSQRPAFLPLALVEGYLRLMDRAGYDPFRTPTDIPQWRRQWSLWRAARSNG